MGWRNADRRGAMIVQSMLDFPMAALWDAATSRTDPVLADYSAASRVPGATVLPGSDRQDSYVFESAEVGPLTLE